jgi:hypothetical protein
LSVTYSRLPSAVVGIADAWAAYQFDLAVAQFGAWVEGKLQERDGKGKPKHTLAKLLEVERARGQGAALTIDMAQVRTVRVKEDGTWDED